MKKYWIGIAVGAGVLAVVLLALFLLAPKVWDSGDTDSRYPYSFTERRKGLDITVSGQVPEGYAWAADLGDATALTAEISKSGNAKTVFSLKAVHSGTVSVKLLLQRQAGTLMDQIYELDIHLRADSDGKIRVLDCGHKELTGLEMGSLSDKDYAIARLADGRLAMQLQDPELWRVEIEQENVGLYSKGGLLYAEGFSQGEDTVLLYHTQGREALRLELSVEGSVVVLQNVSVTEAPRSTESFTNYDLFVRMYGEPAAFEGAVLLDTDVQVWQSFVETDLEIAVGIASYEIDGGRWELLYTNQSRLDDLFRELAEGKPHAKSGTVGGIELQAYADDKLAAAGCVLENGTALLIRAEGSTSAEAYGMLSRIVTGMQHG